MVSMHPIAVFLPTFVLWSAAAGWGDPPEPAELVRKSLEANKA